MSSQTQQLSNGQSTRPYNPKRTDAAGHSDHCLYQTFLTDEGRARSDWLASLIEDGKKQEALKHNVPELRNVYNKLYSAASTVAKSHQGASVSSEERRNTALHHAQGFVWAPWASEGELRSVISDALVTLTSSEQTTGDDDKKPVFGPVAPPHLRRS